MRKFGLLTIACIFAVAGLGVWYVEIHTPRRLLEKAVDATARYSSSCEQKCADILAAQTRPYESKSGLTCRRIDSEDAQFEVCHRSLVEPASHENANNLKKNQLKITSRSLSHDITTDAVIEIGSEKSTATERDVSIATSTSHIFLAWVRQADSSERYVISLKIIDSRTGQDLLEEEVFSKNCCLVNLSITYDRNNAKLLLAWNDWSHADDQNLYFAAVDIKQFLNGKLTFTPKKFNAEDKWDKRSPYFLKDNEQTYLVYMTGDHWGWLSYSGRQSIGLSAMGNSFSPETYHIIASKNPVGKALEIIDGELYYEVLAADTLRPTAIRKMPLNKLIALPLH